MSEPGRNLSAVLDAIVRSNAARTAEPIGEILHPDVVWDGLYEGQRCQGTEQALHFLNNAFANPWRVTRLEAAESENDVIVTAEGPDFVANLPDGSTTPRPSATLTFTFRDGRVIHLQGS